MRVKICGITQVDQALAIARLGATDLGFICVPQSPRYVTPAALAVITQALAAAGVTPGTVGVFANATADEVGLVARQTYLTTVQLHGQETPLQCEQVRELLPQVSIIKAIRVGSHQDLDQALTYAPLVDALLLDAYHPQQLGGTGLTLDWGTLETFAPDCPWLLAGGLTPDNIALALSTLSPDGVDLSSGVEQRPGLKDLDRVARLFEQLQPWIAGDG